MGTVLYFLSPLVISLGDNRFLLAVKCVGLGAGGLALYLALCGYQKQIQAYQAARN
jgi:hypothetical protein